MKELHKAAKDEKENLVPYFLDYVKACATIGEMCNVSRDGFGEWEAVGIT